MSLATGNSAPVSQFLAYDFETDGVFQQGLAGIIANDSLEGKSDAEKQEVILRSQIFYFNRTTGSSITFEELQPHLRRDQPTSSPSTALDPVLQPTKNDEPRQLSLAELKELIESGRTDEIPFNRKIPDDLNPEVPSQSTAPARKKPWETKSSEPE